ncbi:hypothetical protein Acor_14110 [Acrocarpospora corrugata]|uniref:Novel STAND NTPase 1 domain-containing protein n=1 Tax=Acrocarpospora corrugata TaxID=35763 RepID=A0A5M3VY85_9ACTN|nr:hypothetical protein [Acrocarpospora corrugata]GER99347.1 hypothetical protein Acor_14110 [Acrocarpospora corrugata]
MSPRGVRRDPTIQPYVGLRAFRRQDSGKFFGRNREAHEVADLWQANQVTVLHGPSGVGKTSLIQAGVLPLLDPTRTDILPIGRVSHSSAFPSAALPAHNPHVFALLSSWSPEERPTRLAGLSLRNFFQRRPRRQDPYGDPVLTMAAIDQAEELFGDFAHRQPYREWFIDQLVDVLRNDLDLRLLISIRDDYVTAILRDSRLGRKPKGSFALGALEPPAAVQATVGPLQGTGCSFVKGAAERLIDDLRGIRVGENVVAESKVVEPVQLQVVCSALWRSLPPDVWLITKKHVGLFANADRSLVAFADQVIAEVALDHFDNDSVGLRSWLRRNFITAHGTRAAVYRGETMTAGVSNTVVRALVDRHILSLRDTLDTASPDWCELSHERLVQLIRGDDDGSLEIEHRSNAEEYLHAAELSLRDGELALAAKQATEALARIGDNSRLRAEIESFLGNVFFGRGEFAGAIEHYRRAAELFETLGATAAVGRLLAAVGKSRLAQGKTGIAVRELMSAISRVPDDVGIRTELAWALWYDGHPEGARDVLNEILSGEGNVIPALQARAEILADLGEASAALQDFERIKPLQQPWVRAAYALALAMVGRFTEAENEIVAVRAEAAEHGPALLYAARIRALLGDAEGAAELAGQAKSAIAPALPAHLRKTADRLLTVS